MIKHMYTTNAWQGELMFKVFIDNNDEDILSYYKMMIMHHFDNNMEIFTSLDNMVDDVSKIQRENEIVHIKGVSTKNSPILAKTQQTTLYTGEAKEVNNIRNITTFFPNIDTHNESDAIEHLLYVLERLIIIKNCVKNSDNQLFFPVRFRYILDNHRAFADLYLKLSENKMLKLFPEGSEVAFEEINKYSQKGVEVFYIPESRLLVYLELVKRSLGISSTHHDSKTALPISAQLNIRSLIMKLSFDESTVLAATQAINNSISMLMNDISLTKLWHNILKDGNYIVEHGIMISFISTKLLRMTEINSPSNLQKLSIASLLHDCGHTNQMAAIQHDQENYHSSNVMVTSEQTRNDLLKNNTHIQHAVKIITANKNFPHDIDTIILNHHEKYDGSGYPRQLDYNTLTPLSVIFIVAHEIFNEIIYTNATPAYIKEFISRKLNLYQKGYFKDIAAKIPNIIKTNEA